jgi:hypothetical protein
MLFQIYIVSIWFIEGEKYIIDLWHDVGRSHIRLYQVHLTMSRCHKYIYIYLLCICNYSGGIHTGEFFKQQVKFRYNLLQKWNHNQICIIWWPAHDDISAISCRTALVVEETGVSREIYRTWASNW